MLVAEPSSFGSLMPLNGLGEAAPTEAQIKDAEVKAMTEEISQLVDKRMEEIEKRFSDWKKAQVTAELNLRQEREHRDAERVKTKQEVDNLKADLEVALQQSNEAQERRDVELAAQKVAAKVAKGEVSAGLAQKELAKETKKAAQARKGTDAYLPYILGGAAIILGGILIWVIIRK